MINFNLVLLNKIMCLKKTFQISFLTVLGPVMREYQELKEKYDIAIRCQKEAESFASKVNKCKQKILNFYIAKQFNLVVTCCDMS